MARLTATGLQLPDTLVRLVTSGAWPSGPTSREVRQLRPTIPEHRVRRFALEEPVICLAPPSFHTIEDESAADGPGGSWLQFGSLHEIAPSSSSLVIGDFGLGSDAPVIRVAAR